MRNAVILASRSNGGTSTAPETKGVPAGHDRAFLRQIEALDGKARFGRFMGSRWPPHLDYVLSASGSETPNLEKAMNRIRFIVLAGMILAASISRLIPHPPNFTPLAALALFGGASFASKRAAFFVPSVGLVLSDLVLGFYAITLSSMAVLRSSPVSGSGCADGGMFGGLRAQP